MQQQFQSTSSKTPTVGGWELEGGFSQHLDARSQEYITKLVETPHCTLEQLTARPLASISSSVVKSILRYGHLRQVTH